MPLFRESQSRLSLGRLLCIKKGSLPSSQVNLIVSHCEGSFDMNWNCSEFVDSLFRVRSKTAAIATKLIIAICVVLFFMM